MINAVDLFKLFACQGRARFVMDAITTNVSTIVSLLTVSTTEPNAISSVGRLSSSNSTRLGT